MVKKKYMEIETLVQPIRCLKKLHWLLTVEIWISASSRLGDTGNFGPSLPHSHNGSARIKTWHLHCPSAASLLPACCLPEPLDLSFQRWMSCGALNVCTQEAEISDPPHHHHQVGWRSASALSCLHTLRPVCDLPCAVRCSLPSPYSSKGRS